jgi:hypothetical protein
MALPDDIHEINALRYATRTSRKCQEHFRYDLYGSPGDVQRMDYFFWLLRNGDRTVLVDRPFKLFDDLGDMYRALDILRERRAAGHDGNSRSRSAGDRGVPHCGAGLPGSHRARPALTDRGRATVS